MNQTKKLKSRHDSKGYDDFHQMIQSLEDQKCDLMETSPLDALGLDLVINSALDLRNARRDLNQVEKTCHESAKRRRFQEESIETSTLPQRLLKSPQATLAEARSSLSGCRQIVQMWRSLGCLLQLKEGWNDDELQLARCLVGQGSEKIRFSRDAIRLQQALNADRELPSLKRHQSADLHLSRYSESLLEGLREISPEESSLHSAILRLFSEKEMELLGQDSGEDLHEKTSNHNHILQSSGNLRWPALRHFVARQLRHYRKVCRAYELKNEIYELSDRPLNYSVVEHKRIDSARKSVSSAIACFQKSIATAKSMGLLGDGKTSKSKTNESSPAKNSRNVIQSIELMQICDDELVQKNTRKPERKNRIINTRKSTSSHVSQTRCNLKASGEIKQWLHPQDYRNIETGEAGGLAPSKNSLASDQIDSVGLSLTDKNSITFQPPEDSKFDLSQNLEVGFDHEQGPLIPENLVVHPSDKRTAVDPSSMSTLVHPSRGATEVDSSHEAAKDAFSECSNLGLVGMNNRINCHDSPNQLAEVSKKRQTSGSLKRRESKSGPQDRPSGNTNQANQQRECAVMKSNPVKAALKQGRPQIGTWLSLGSVAAARFLARQGLPWLTVDVEHTHTDMNTAAMMFGAIADGGTVPLARIPVGDHTWIKRMLDCGAYGVVAPMIMNAEEAELVVKACKYPPEGNRSVGGGFHALNFDAKADEYYNKANNEILAIIQTEHIEAVEIADKIYSVPGIDAVFVGPNDLAASMRTPDGQWPSKERQEEVLQEILAACKRNNVPAGLHVFSVEDALRRAAEGWQFIAVNSELRFMLEGARQLAEQTGVASSQGIAKY